MMSDEQKRADYGAALARAIAKLESARDEWETANDEKEVASTRECNARNALDKAQKEFDVAVANVRDAPPWNSHWHNERKREDRTIG